MTSSLNNRTLSSIIVEFFSEDETKNVLFCDAGNGCAFGEMGQFADYDAATMGDLIMTDIPADADDVWLEDGKASSITQSEWQDGENGYRWRVRF
jgi:hypothetical protein